MLSHHWSKSLIDMILLYLFLPFFLSSSLHWVFLAVETFSSCSEWVLLFILGHGLIIVVASFVVEQNLGSQFSSVAQSCPTLCDSMNRSMPSPTPGVHSDSCPSSQWYHPAISSSVVPFSSCLQSFPASGSFPESINEQICELLWIVSLSLGFITCEMGMVNPHH